MNLDMGLVSLEILSPHISMESKNVQLDVVCDLNISFNVDNSWTSWTPDIEIVSAPRISAIRKFISSSLCAYVERPNPISYASCTSI
jgi:hypothetical protein